MITIKGTKYNGESAGLPNKISNEMVPLLELSGLVNSSLPYIETDPTIKSFTDSLSTIILLPFVMVRP
jgi:hypothetical protein